ncbi:MULTISPECIES: aminotransferase class I/II-fold pyridoxal phosphate-dependent enzyme [unclassified Chelatococcus]|uniref:O-acetylhomoserine aminocarboxypropyltransferase/cysteine synthase family protein n=1 Tax=unclassified Chelatococcus TaxID=2638111 RepID=UPI001BCD8FE0|nr:MULTISPECIES: aminotransferase class I/II-fold pyridoxal phosphate-dependent enzyme [unclassified Chelatococcus]CAH1671884.1 O-acetyl-L-homoserine sulfhydrylase [Hyphomicrobiales bacterium]MBS7739025.1 aminotransferase class I/II-fold pyridoxal phosphate-dependent enzyme [Chelatococcus sp. HY11]MBX3543460.1 aminotransferase class I/II-fold pyridoxal phosphate-dependent enzyme [Chelatococcus sp.]MCO5076445.1 aminotransferase class I/II-fold pyridoxal phosphate-dependent enzyme [Chelatococcus 
MSEQANKPLAFATRAVQAGTAPDPATGARATPMFLTNGFVFDGPDMAADIFAMRQTGFSYSRGSNPTTAPLERRIASLEGGTGAVAIGSGQAALLVILMTLLESGDEYLAASILFGGSLGLMGRLAKRNDVKPIFVDADRAENFERAITPKTKAIIIESIVNPSGEVVDIEAIAKVAQKHNLPLIVDNTLATPFLIRPFEYGADIVFHSASKFLGGHGQVIGGAIVDGGRFNWTGDKRFPMISEPWPDYGNMILTEKFPASPFAVASRLYGLRDLGPGLSPFNAFMILTGIETLPLRMKRHCANAHKVASYLAAHPAVASVSYPGLAGNPNRELALRYSPLGPGSVFTFAHKDGEQGARRFLKNVKLFSHLANIGETRSLAIHPATTTHKSMKPELQAKAGVGPEVIRMSIGLEDPKDLINDLEQALATTA